MFGMFKRKKKEITVTLHKVENRDLMEAICAGAVLVGYADGSFSDEEQKKLEGIIASNSNLAHFGSEIGKTIDQYCLMFEAGVRTARMKLMKEIEDLESNEDQKIEAFLIMIDIADSDGEIDEKELEVLQNIGRTLGLNPEKYI